MLSANFILIFFLSLEYCVIKSNHRNQVEDTGEDGCVTLIVKVWNDGRLKDTSFSSFVPQKLIEPCLSIQAKV